MDPSAEQSHGQTESVVQRFLNYPFDQDPEYQAGLQAILASANASGANAADLEFEAKVFFFRRATGNDSLTVEDVKRVQKPSQPSSSSPPQQQQQQQPNDPPYSVSYKEIVELILSGKPIPGIKTIPDTVLGTEAASKAEAAPRKKPWEK